MLLMKNNKDKNLVFKRVSNSADEALKRVFSVKVNNVTGYENYGLILIDPRTEDNNEKLFVIYDLEKKEYCLNFVSGDIGIHTTLNYDPTAQVKELRTQGYKDKFFIFLYIYFENKFKKLKEYNKLKAEIPFLISRCIEISLNDIEA